MNDSDPDTLWKTLQVVSRRIQRRDVARSLTQLNEAADAAEAETDPVLTAMVRLLAADAEFKNGRFQDAAAIYALARANGQEHQEGHLVFRAGLGEVLSLLKLSQADEALSVGNQLLLLAAEPPPELPDPAPNGEELAVPSLMPPAAAVARRLGAAFMREGYNAEALTFLAQAQDPANVGSLDALWAAEHEAILLLQQSDPVAAEAKLTSARETAGDQLTLSVKGWRALITARFQRQSALFGPDDNSFLAKITANRSRAVVQLAIISRLRECGDASWKSWIHAWGLTSNHVHAATRLAAQKLLLAECRASNGDQFGDRAALAAAVSSNPKATPTDHISASRDALLAATASGNEFDEAPLLAAAEQQFGPSARLRVLHTLSKAATEAKDSTLAVRLLEQVRSEAGPNSTRRLQASQSLATLEFERQNFSAAALLSEELARSPALSPVFRLQALNRLCASLRLLGGRDEERDLALSLVAQIIPADADALSLLTMARMVKLSEFGNPALLSDLITRATASAQSEQAKADHPSNAANILLAMARKLFWDFQAPASITLIWTGLGADRRDWLWSPSSVWWEYVSLVMRSYSAVGDAGNAQSLMDMALNDAPVEGRVWARSAAADLKREAGDLQGALVIYRQSAAEDPSHPENARACYWLALQASAAGEAGTASDWLRGVRRCLGSSISFLWQWEVDARARILLNPGVPFPELAQGTKYDAVFLEQQHLLLTADLAGFSQG